MYPGCRKSRYEFDARAIEQTGDFKVLRKLRPIQDVIADEGEDALIWRQLMRSGRMAGEHKVVFIDTETTGLRPTVSDAVEVGAVALAYDLSKGVFTRFLGSVSMLEDPGYPIPPWFHIDIGVRAE